MQGSQGPQGRTDPERSAGSGREEGAVPPGRRFSDTLPGGCGLPAAWRGGDRRFGCFRSLAALLLNPAFLTHSLWPRQVISPESQFSHSQGADGNRAHVVELRRCNEVTWLPRSAQWLLSYGILIFPRLLPASVLFPLLFPSSNTLSKSCSVSCPTGILVIASSCSSVCTLSVV